MELHLQYTVHKGLVVVPAGCNNINSLVSTGDSGRQPPPSSAPASGDQSRHNNS